MNVRFDVCSAIRACIDKRAKGRIRAAESGRSFVILLSTGTSDVQTLFDSCSQFVSLELPILLFGRG